MLVTLASLSPFLYLSLARNYLLIHNRLPGVFASLPICCNGLLFSLEEVILEKKTTFLHFFSLQCFISWEPSKQIFEQATLCSCDVPYEDQGLQT